MDGTIAGTWRHERRGHGLRGAIAPFAPLPQAVRAAAEAEAERIAAWLGTPAEVAWDIGEAPVPL